MELIIKEVICGAQTIALVSLMAADVILAIIAAIKTGKFTFRSLGDFVPNRVLPLLAYIVIGSLAKLTDGWAPVAVSVYVGLVAMYSTAILTAVREITGVDIPDMLVKKRVG